MSTRSGSSVGHIQAKRGEVAENAWIPTTCFSCNHGPCLIRIHRVNGVAVSVEGNIEGPGFVESTKSRGRICPKPYGLIQKLYNPHRIKAPLKRSNPQKGRGIDPKWVEIGWDEALNMVAEKLRKIRAEDSRKLCLSDRGPQMISVKGTWWAFRMAFGPFQSLLSAGSSRCDLAEHIFGNQIHGGFSCEPDVEYCNYLLLIGRNPRGSGGVAENIQYTEAQRRGMKMIVIDPVLTITAAKADEWIPIKPGTDLAFELALINVLLNEIGVFDIEFLKNMTNSPYLVRRDGYFVRDKVSNKVLVWDPVDAKAKTYDDDSIKDFSLEGVYMVEGEECRPAFQVMKDHFRQYTPEWAYGISEVPASTIRRIAREWVTNARIGSTIEIEGAVLPYRPVASKIGRGITGNMRSYQSMLCEHIMAALVGALEAVGGHCGGRPTPGGWEEKMPHHGIFPGPDGMVAPEIFPFTWPPISYDGSETLLPFSKVLPYHVGHLAYRNLVDPPKNWPTPPLPELLIRYRLNPLVAVGDPDLVERALCKVPLLVSIAYTFDEVTELADIVLPDNLELERYELSTQVRRPLSRVFTAIALRQPVVEPLWNTMDIADILTELAERTGFLDDYNMAVNDTLGLIDPYRLEKGKKYAWVDIVDRHCKSATKGAHDLEWFKRNGAIVSKPGVEKQYSVHPVMVAKKLRYPIPYMEYVKRTGEELAQNLSKVGIDWWPTSEYVPLPIYVPSVLEEVPPEYDFYVTVTRSIQVGWGSNVDLPWMIELGYHERGLQNIVMNASAAKSKGIQDGDEIWIESSVGRVRGKVKLIEGIRPDTVLIAGAFGHWSTPIAKDSGRASQTPLVPISHEWTDPVVGCMQGNTVKAKVYKA